MSRRPRKRVGKPAHARMWLSSPPGVRIVSPPPGLSCEAIWVAELPGWRRRSQRLALFLWRVVFPGDG